MSRPALVVGVGGTGQWVLTWVKRSLKQAHGGEIPDNIRLLSIDTTSQLEADAAQVTVSTNANEDSEEIRVGDVSLEEHEFIHLGGDSFSFVDDIRDGKYAQIDNWFHADIWRERLSPAAFILDDGAGRIRQLGRLSIFKEMVIEGGQNLWRAVETFLLDIRNEISEKRKLEVILVGSFAGGTGSGIFLDVALLLRLMAKKYVSHHALKGLFALPWAFTPSPDDDMLARSFAAWRELNRFMVIKNDFPMPDIEYVQNDPNKKIRPDTRLFDACYLIDGRRQGDQIADDAQFGAHPIMAEVVSAFLDENAGQAYETFITTNLNPIYAKNVGVPLYSTVGAYTIQIPVQYVQERSAVKFSQALLLKMLSPKQKPEDDGSWIASGTDRHLKIAATNHNLEDEGCSGRKRSQNIFEKSVEFAGETAKPSRFVGRIGELLEQITDDSQRSSQVDRLARAGTSSGRRAISSASWMAYFPDLGDNPEFEALRKQVQEHMKYNLIRDYKRREGQSARETRRNFSKIPEDIRTRFGSDLISGESEEEFFGKCGSALEKLQEAQVSLFKRLIRLRLLKILNGSSDDPLIAKGGKLGYAWDFLDGVGSDLNKMEEFIADVHSRRQEIKPELKLSGLRERARRFLSDTDGKKLLWFWEHPQVENAEMQYLQVYQRLVNLRREDLLHLFVQGTVRKMQKDCEQAKNQVLDWILHLSTGDDASRLKGAWDKLIERDIALEEAHSFDQRIQHLQKLLKDDVLEVTEADLKDALSRWSWSMVYTDEGDYHLQAVINDKFQDEAVDLENPGLEKNITFKNEIVKKNFAHLRDFSSTFYHGMVARTTIANEIKKKYGTDSDAVRKFVNQNNLSDKAEPLSATVGNPERKSGLIQVKINENDPFFVGADGLEGELREKKHLSRGQKTDDFVIQVVGSENPYKFSIIRTDDLRKKEAFTAWEDCQEAYEHHMSDEYDELDPILLHNFSAEIRAAKIERRLVEHEGRDYRALNPRIVMLLENEEGLKQFLWLRMLNKINETSFSENPYRWELNWKRSSGEETIWLTSPYETGQIGGSDKPRPDIVDAIHGYAIRGETFEPGRNFKVDYKYASIFLRREWHQMGLDKRASILRENLNDPDGFVKKWDRLARNPDYVGTNYAEEDIQHEDFRDLALVARFILADELKGIQVELDLRNAKSS